MMKVKLMGIPDGRSSQLHALATFLHSIWVLYPMDKKLELMWVTFPRPSINYRQQKCHRYIWMSFKFVNQFLNAVYKTAKVAFKEMDFPTHEKMPPLFNFVIVTKKSDLHFISACCVFMFFRLSSLKVGALD